MLSNSSTIHTYIFIAKLVCSLVVARVLARPKQCSQQAVAVSASDEAAKIYCLQELGANHGTCDSDWLRREDLDGVQWSTIVALKTPGAVDIRESDFGEVEVRATGS